ncbi:hypothetical protein DFQ27_009650, partial [Actinomortierella ambigua]
MTTQTTEVALTSGNILPLSAQDLDYLEKKLCLRAPRQQPAAITTVPSKELSMNPAEARAVLCADALPEPSVMVAPMRDMPASTPKTVASPDTVASTVSSGASKATPHTAPTLTKQMPVHLSASSALSAASVGQSPNLRGTSAHADTAKSSVAANAASAPHEKQSISGWAEFIHDADPSGKRDDGRGYVGTSRHYARPPAIPTPARGPPLSTYSPTRSSSFASGQTFRASAPSASPS